MFEGLLQKAKAYWYRTLIAVAFAGFLVNLAIFFPAYMSNDTVGHVGRALGVYPVTDLSPPMMTLIWRVLIDITGSIGSMLVFQLGMFWTALGLLAAYVFRLTKSKRLSLLPLGIAFLPFVLNISGVIWTDNQLTFALLLSVAITLHIPVIQDERWRRTAIVGSLLLIVYACLVRYNTVLAVTPLIFYIIRQSGYLPRIRWQLAATGVLCLFILSLIPLVNVVMHARASHPVAAVMLDDILQVNSMEGIEKSSLSPQLKKQFVAMKQCQQEKAVVLNNFWECATDSTRRNMQFGHYNEVKSLWLRTVFGNPIQYALYRTETFTLFMTAPQGFAFIWQDGIVPNEFGLQPAAPRLGNIVEIYVMGFGHKYFSFLFEPWFWTIVAIILLIKRRTFGKHRALIVTLSLSSLIYIASYLPTGATGDYRYIYWPVLALLAAGILVSVDYQPRKRKRS